VYEWVTHSYVYEWVTHSYVYEWVIRILLECPLPTDAQLIG